MEAGHPGESAVTDSLIVFAFRRQMYHNFDLIVFQEITKTMVIVFEDSECQELFPHVLKYIFNVHIIT